MNYDGERYTPQSICIALREELALIDLELGVQWKSDPLRMSL